MVGIGGVKIRGMITVPDVCGEVWKSTVSHSHMNSFALSLMFPERLDQSRFQKGYSKRRKRAEIGWRVMGGRKCHLNAPKSYCSFESWGKATQYRCSSDLNIFMFCFDRLFPLLYHFKGSTYEVIFPLFLWKAIWDGKFPKELCQNQTGFAVNKRKVVMSTEGLF